MESIPQNLNGGHQVKAPFAAESVKSSDAPKKLTKHGIWNMKDWKTGETQQNQGLYLQVTHAKVFQLEAKNEKEDENGAKSKKKLNIKAKYGLSDGIAQIRVLIPEPVFNKMKTEPKQFDVIRVDNLSKQTVSGTLLCMIKSPMEVVNDSVGQLMGNPMDLQKLIENKGNIEFDQDFDIPQPEQKVEAKQIVEKQNVTVGMPPVQKEKVIVEDVPMVPQDDDPENEYMPIKALNTFTRDWIIKARVASKGDKKITKKGGSLLKIELVDKFNTCIEGTFFNDAADIFDSKLKENHVYTFASGVVRMANKKFTSVRNDFCIVFEKNSVISEKVDDGSICNQAFDFCKIAQVQEIVQLKTIDVVGIISDLGEKENVNLKTGKSKLRRYIELTDDSEAKISLTLWGEEACNKHELQVGDLLAIKAARVSDYGGRSLNAADDHAQLFKEKDFKNDKFVNNLLKWYWKLRDQGQSFEESTSGFDQLTRKPQNRNGENGYGFNSKKELEKQNKASNLNLIVEINESLQEANDTDQYHFFFLNGYISRIKNDERIFYPACKSENCRRKVVEDQTGFRCESCNKTFMDYNPTYMITALISDFSESIYVNFAREHGTSLMGMTAEEFKNFRETESEEKVQKFFDDLTFKPFNIMVKGKYEYFNNETRMRYFAVKVFPHNVQNENRALLSRLQMYENI